MNVCFFGSYDPDYARNKILIDGLQKNGAKVIHCRSMSGSILVRYPELIRQFFQIRNQVDIIFVAFVGHLNVPLAYILGKLFRKKVVFDMFYSMFDTYVFDRKSFTENSLKARSFWWIDKIAVTLADRVITDTQTHAEYFSKLLGVPLNKFRRVFVGGDDTLFKPSKKRANKKLRVIFHGMFTRLHGAEYFVEAAKLLENEKDIEFFLVGSSTNYVLPIELYKKLKPKNLTYYPEMPVEKLVKFVASCDISVGHLGTTKKARSVITNKMFQAVSSRVLVIAGDCPAIRELFTEGETAFFVPMGDPKKLALAIKTVAGDKKMRNTITENGYILSRDLTNEKIASEVISVCEEIL